LAEPNIWDKARTNPKRKSCECRTCTHQEQIPRAHTFLLAARKPSSRKLSIPAVDYRRDIQEGWWLVKKYNCMGCHQLIPGQRTSLMAMAHYQGPDGQELLPPKLLTEGARVDPEWNCSVS